MVRHKNLSLFISLWLALAICSCVSSKGFAQSSSATTGAIVGTVKDPSGAVIAGANVSVRNLSTNLMRTSQANEQGLYFFSQLTPGAYEISANADGFQPKVDKVIVNLGTTALVDASLSVESIDLEVFQVIDSVLVNGTKTESSTNIGSQAITGLPINRRDFISFALTAARVTRDALPSQSSITTSGLSINGQSPRNNNITIDGVNNNSFAGGGSLLTFSQEAVQEFQVISDGFSSEVGRSSSGSINIITRSGGNDLKGNLFFFFRNNDLSARNAFSQTIPEFRQYQFGSTLSGAIKPNKVFFFSAFERLSIKQNNIVTISNETIASINRQGFFQRNGSIPFSVSTTTALVKLDFIVSPKDSFTVRYNGGGSYDGAAEQFGALIGDTSGGQQRIKDNSLAISNNYFDSNFFNETRFIFSRRDRGAFPIGNQPNIRVLAPEGMVMAGQSIILSQFTKERTFQLLNNTSISFGKHNVKFGLDDIFIQTLPGTFSQQFTNGVYLFSPLDFSAITGLPNLPKFTALEALDPTLRSPQQKAFLSLLSTNPGNLFPGLPSNLPLADLPAPMVFLQGFGNTRSEVSGNLFSAFIQDDFKFKPNLLIKLGLRYDLTRASFIPRNNGNFSPRVAFSYNPNRFSKLNVSASYGLFFSRPLGAFVGLIEAYERGLKILPLTFPFSTLPLQFPGKSFPQSNTLPTNVSFIPQFSLFNQIDKNFRNSYSQQVNFKLGLKVSSNTLISTEYAFVRGIKLVSSREINPIVRPIANDPIGSAINGRIDPSRGVVFEVESAFDSYYNALSLTLNQVVKNNFSILASYTYSKAIDNAADVSPLFAEVNDTLKIAQERGFSLQDIRNRFVFSGVFDTNFFRNAFLKSFQFSSIVTLESGKPYNLLAGRDLNLSGDLLAGDRPLSIGRNVGLLPGFANVDLRLGRKINIKEKFSLQTTLEVFNLFNRINISEIDRVFPPDDNGNFQLPKQDKSRFISPPERFRGAFSPRQFQIGLKLSF